MDDPVVTRSMLDAALGQLRTELRTELSALRTDMRTEWRTELRTELARHITASTESLRSEFRVMVDLIRAQQDALKAQMDRHDEHVADDTRHRVPRRLARKG